MPVCACGDAPGGNHSVRSNRLWPMHTIVLGGATITLAAAIAVAVAIARPALAEDLSDRDRLAALYSAEFRFTNDGVPVVPVAIADGLQTVRIKGAGGLRL